MLYNAKNKSLAIGDTDMNYITFGYGRKNLVIIPGLGDGLKTVKGAALPIAIMYKRLVKDYNVYAFSRKNSMPEGYTIKEMADDLASAIKKLNLNKTSVIGVSQGGMIAQHLAVNYPDMIDRLVLAVTMPCQNEIITPVLEKWTDLARQNRFNEIFIDTAEKTYSEKYLKKLRPLYPLMCRIAKPKDLSRFIIQATACKGQDIYDRLDTINCPTFVIGGKEDKIVGVDASYRIAEKIKGSQLKIYDGLGHGCYEEAKDFTQQVYDFLNK